MLDHTTKRCLHAKRRVEYLMKILLHRKEFYPIAQVTFRLFGFWAPTISSSAT